MTESAGGVASDKPVAQCRDADKALAGNGGARGRHQLRFWRAAERGRAAAALEGGLFVA